MTLRTCAAVEFCRLSPRWPAEYLPQRGGGGDNYCLKCKCEALTEVSGTASSAGRRELQSVQQVCFFFFLKGNYVNAGVSEWPLAAARMAAAEQTTAFICLCLKCSRHYFAHAKCIYYMRRPCTLARGGNTSGKSFKS